MRNTSIHFIHIGDAGCKSKCGDNGESDVDVGGEVSGEFVPAV